MPESITFGFMFMLDSFVSILRLKISTNHSVGDVNKNDVSISRDIIVLLRAIGKSCAFVDMSIPLFSRKFISVVNP